MPAFRTLLAFLLLSSFAAADELRTLDNKTYTGTVVAVTEKEVGIKTADGVIAVPLDNVIALDLRAVKGPPPKYTDVRLVDDTVLHCDSFAFKGKDVELTLFTKQKITVPLASVAYILKDAQDAKLRERLEKTLADKAKRDWVWIKIGEQINPLDGTLSEPDAKGEKFGFRPVDEKEFRQLAISKLQALIFYRQYTGVGNPVCMVYDISGNALAANKVSVDGNKVVVETTLKTTVAWDKDAVARFDYNMGKLAFLSDMVPSKVVEKSAVGLIVTYRKDVNLDGDPILLDGHQYAKGLSMHAYTELEYDLKGKFKTFTAVVGVDTRVGAESEATVTIQADGRMLFNQVVTPKTHVPPLKLDVTKVNTLRIVVSSRNILDLHDHVTIAVPKVSQ
jgi:hypothetical protein